MEILAEYKKYEYLLNVDKKELIENLFDNKELLETTGSAKADIKAIRATIQLYHEAADEIMNLSNDYVDTPMFRVQAQKLKDTLSQAALKLRNRVIESVEKWCNDTVNNIQNTFEVMEKTIEKTPQDEK